MFYVPTSWPGKDLAVENKPNPCSRLDDGHGHRREANINTTEIKVSKDICSVAFLADGKHIVGGGYGGIVRIWQAEDGQEVGTAMNAGSTVLNIVVSSDGKLVVGGTGNGRVIVWNTERREKVQEVKAHENWVRAVDLSPDATRIASGSDDKRACVWSLESGKLLLGPLEHDNILAAVKFSPNGNLFATATWWTEAVRIYDSQDGCFLMSVPVRVNSYENQSLAWLLNGTLLFASSFEGDIKRLDVSTGALHSHWPVYAGSGRSIKSMVIANNGKFIAASANSFVFFWDTETHKQIGPLIEHTDVIRSIAISQNYNFAISGGKTITIRRLRDILPSHYVDDLCIGTCEQEVRSGRDRCSSDDSAATIVVDDGAYVFDTSKKLDFFITSPRPVSGNMSSLHDECSLSDLTCHVKRDGHDPVASGGFADIYRGMLQTSPELIRVAIKAIRTYSAEDGNFYKKQKRLLREIKIWLTLKHINVLPLLGTTTGFGRFPAMVCPWIDHGSLTTYLEECYDQLSSIELLTLLNDAASGLQYLHSRSVVHGDLSGSNVLVCKARRAYISDFGLSTLLTELGESSFTSSVYSRGTLRWTAPELLDLQVSDDEAEPSKVAPNKHSDMYSFGSVALQILTGKVPYHYYVREAQVINAVSRGFTPRKPSNPLVTECRWLFMQRCWSSSNEPHSRPSSDDLVYFTRSELTRIVV